MSNQEVKKAVFPVAGFGTRFLPATKAMPKELLPIINKPLIQYAAEEAIAAGIDTLIFVTGKNKRAIEDHFDGNFELEMALRAAQKNTQADMVKNILPKNVECIFVRQPEQRGLGDAILCAERAVGGEPFAVLLADDFLLTDKVTTTSSLVRNFLRTGKVQMSVMEVNDESIINYGVIKPAGRSGKVLSVVEKPMFKDAPSNLAAIGRYVLTPKIFDCLREISYEVGNEIQLTDAINLQAISGNVEFVKFLGQRFDCGSVKGFIDAIICVARKEKIF